MDIQQVELAKSILPTAQKAFEYVLNYFPERVEETDEYTRVRLGDLYDLMVRESEGASVSSLIASGRGELIRVRGEELVLARGILSEDIEFWSMVAQRLDAIMLKEVTEIAKSVIGAAFPITEEGMTVTELANIITESLGKSIKADRVNKALVELGYQERNEAKRTWSLTETGKEHGVSFLATSATNAWSGVQVKWRRSVISVLLNYLQENIEQSNSLTNNGECVPLSSFEDNGSSENNSSSNQTASKDNSKRKKNWTIAERIKSLDRTRNKSS